MKFKDYMKEASTEDWICPKCNRRNIHTFPGSPRRVKERKCAYCDTYSKAKKDKKE
jgi:hypothetical protein